MLGTNMGVCSLDLGWIGLGYGFGDGATGLVLVDAASWSGRTVTAMRGAAGVHDDEHVARANFRSAH